MICESRNGLVLYLLFVLGLGLSACRQNIPPIEVKQKTPEILSTPTLSSPLQVPTPSPGTAIVRGQLIAVTPSARVFLAGEIYLAPLIYTEGSTSIPFIRVKPGEDPKATIRNEVNEFAILDVPPGKYGIVIHTPVNDYVVPDETGGFFVIEIQAGEIIDLGVIELR